MENKLTPKENLFKGATPRKFEFARLLRHELTPAEAILWHELKNRKLSGAKFRRQHAISFYIADFYCHEVQLVIEIDGGVHEIKENKRYDENRTEVLNSLNVSLLRFTNDRIQNDLAGVLSEINSNLIRLRHLLL